MDSKKFRNGIHLQPLSADPSSPEEGDIFVSDGTSRGKGLWIYKDSAWTKAGGGSGGLDVFLAEDFQSTKASNFSSGNNASFLGGGTVAGTLADEEVNQIAGNRSIKFTLAAGSANDYIAAPAITLDDKQKGQDVGLTFYYTYSGADDDITVIVYDVTNASVISSSLDLIKAASNPTRFSTSVYIPTTCNSIRYGFKVNSASGSEVFVFDDVELSTNPFVYKNLVEVSDWTSYDLVVGASVTPPTTGTIVFNQARWRRVGDSMEIHYAYRQTSAGTNGSGAYYYPLPSGYKIDTNKLKVGDFGNSDASVVVGYGTGGNVIADGYSLSIVPYDDSSLGVYTVYGVGACDVHGSAALEYGQADHKLSFFAKVPIAGWSSSSEHVVTPAKSAYHHYYISQAQTALTNRTVEVEFNLGTATISEVKSNQDLIVAEDDSGNTRTKFIAQEDIIVDVHWNAAISSGIQSVYKNGVYYVYGNKSGASDERCMSVEIPLLAGDYITVGATGDLANNGVVSQLILSARKREATFLAAVPKVQWQHKYMSSSNNYADMSFSGLVVGRIYRYTADLYMSGGNTATGSYTLTHNGVTLVSRGIEYVNTTGWNEKEHRSFSIVFKAEASTVTFSGSPSGFTFVGNGTGSGQSCYAMIEELNYHAPETTRFT